MRSHAALPLTIPLDERRVRVYCCGRDEKNRAQIGSFDLDLTEPNAPKTVTSEPAISRGTLGAFDDSGVTASCIVAHEGCLYQYFTGWQLGVTVPFYFAVGVAVSDDAGATWERASLAPVLGRDAMDPYLIASPSVLIEDGLWRMWYVSGLRWEIQDGNAKHYYHIRYAESDDGLHWRRDGRVCVDFADDGEYAFGRPCVVRDEDCYRMWYCVRGETYRIGYAESSDGLTWQRCDGQAGIDVSADGWDSEMLAYPHVFDHAGTRYLLYNGNGYGKTGIGLAQAE